MNYIQDEQSPPSSVRREWQYAFSKQSWKRLKSEQYNIWNFKYATLNKKEVQHKKRDKNIRKSRSSIPTEKTLLTKREVIATNGIRKVC